ncbi:MAG: type II toxin-antitoxin system RelE/ParE family toxin, partial [Candidatus Binatia bacterium]
TLVPRGFPRLRRRRRRNREIVDNFDGSTYRAIYTVRFAAAVYVLHVFQKKSKRGAKMPPRDKALIDSRLKLAAQDAESKEEE